MKREKFFKQNFVGFIIGGIIFGTLGVYAAITFPSNEVSFDPSNSTLKSTDVQGAIDELYTECTHVLTGGEAILDDVDIVTSGDGLYADEYEDGRYFYRGANPNNYITFNEEIDGKAGWRIISVEKDGTIKITSTKAFFSIVIWDNSNLNDWTQSSLMNFFNGNYLTGEYFKGLNSKSQSQIVSHEWSIGAIEESNNDLAKQINDENSKKWNGKVGLITLSEYLRANNDMNNCGTYTIYNRNHMSCRDSNWILSTLSAGYLWTINAVKGSSYQVFYIYNGGPINPSSTDDDNTANPVVYLSSEVKITGGTGTQSDPYTIE